VKLVKLLLLLILPVVVLIAVGCTPPRLSERLCANNEEVLFSFKDESSARVVSLCVAGDQYIVCRIGTPNKLELEFPKSKTNSWQLFTYSYYFRGGGPDNEGVDLNHLRFEHGGKEYEIYQEHIAADATTYVGVRITGKGTQEDIRGAHDSVVGSLMELRDNDKIKK